VKTNLFYYKCHEYDYILDNMLENDLRNFYVDRLMNFIFYFIILEI